MKTFVGLAFVVLAAFGLSFAAGSSNAPDRPRGIAADHWALISSTLGVVLVTDSERNALPRAMGAVDETGLIADPSPAVQAIIDEGQPVRGYLMVKRGKVWRPLTVVPPTVDN